MSQILGILPSAGSPWDPLPPRKTELLGAPRTELARSKGHVTYLVSWILVPGSELQEGVHAERDAENA